MNVPTQLVYSALGTQGVTSAEALANPWSPYVTLDHSDFLVSPAPPTTADPAYRANVLSRLGVIGDPHFVARDRMGRDLAFLCRIWDSNQGGKRRSVSIDSVSALEINESAIAKVVGAGNAYFLKVYFLE